MIRSVWVYVVGIVLTLVHAGPVVLRSAIGRPGSDGWCWRRARQWSLGILRAAGVRVRIEGRENLATDGSQILVANHESWFDVFALSGYLPMSNRFVAKKELAKIPLFGPAWVSCGHISIDRGDRSSAIDVLGEAVSRIKAERPTIIMFPEGTRTKDGGLQRFKKGAFVLALQAGVPIVPVGISGSRAVMPKGGKRIRPGTITVRIGRPISVEGLTHEHRDDLARHAREAVERLREPADATTGVIEVQAERAPDPGAAEPDVRKRAEPSGETLT